MIEFAKRLLYDETFFERATRVLVALFGQLLHDGAIPGMNGSRAWWVGPFLTALALYIPAGQKNPEPAKP